MFLNFRDVGQAEAAECGLACLAIASGILGAQLDMAELRRRHPVSARGLTLKELGEIAGALDMSGRAVRCELDELPLLSCPAILHWDLSHFVVLEQVRGRKAHIIDPAGGRSVVKLEDLSRRFTGVALELSATPAFQKRRERSPLKLSSLFRWTPQMTGSLAQAFLLSLLLQAYIVASPFYIQLAIDEAALKGDGDLLIALAIGFGLFAAFNTGAEALRGIALQRVSALLAWDMTRRLFHHMVRLPLPWFQRRKLADALTRFDSLDPVKNLVANGLVSAVLDGLLSVVTLAMMVAFAPKLALISLVALALYIALRIAAIPTTMRLGMGMLTASIAEQGKRIETLRVMQTIKVMAAETEREGDWANKFAETIRTGQSTAYANITFSALERLFDALAMVLVIFLGASAVIDGTMTIGMLYAFLAYRAQFVGRVQGLLEQLIGWRMLDLHTHRLADIALHPVETGIDQLPIGLSAIDGRIELKGLAFSYAPHEPSVFKGVDLTIESGEFVAIVGPSGAGKSTLLKVMCGLYTPTAGEVRIDGLPINAWGPRAVRQSLGAVMQDDELLSGTLADNVAFFDDKIDMRRVWDCLEAAAIAEEVRAMPMQTNTLVGDMGSTLSGGQKQRVLLARALYKNPRILILDEATSHLDTVREKTINSALKALNITRIVVAHRLETINAADRVLHLSGSLKEMRIKREAAVRL